MVHPLAGTRLGWGLLLLCLAPVAADAQVGVHAQISGSVFDSVSNTPLVGAIVRMVRVDNPAVGRTALTDSVGRFRHDTVAAGSWLATFLHPSLDSLRLEPGVVRVEINDTSAVQLLLSTPSPRSLVLASCPGQTGDDVGVIVGDVRRAEDDAPLAAATVSVEWPEWLLQKGRLVTERRRLSARSDSAGRYVLCGAPNGSTMRGVGFEGADSTGIVEVVTPEAGYTVFDFAVAPVERLAVSIDETSALTTMVRRGSAVVRGRVTTSEDRPLAHAVVRVLGSGSQVRSAPDGSFVISDAAAGTQTLEARAIGYAPRRRPVRLNQASSLAVDLQLAVQGVQLDTVRVTAGTVLTHELRGIERRWRTGSGTILDGNVVRARANLFVTDALRGVAGVTIRQVGGYGQAVMMRSSRGLQCEAQVYVDGGMLTTSPDFRITIDEYAAREDIAALEIYPRPTMVPAEFLTLNDCGVVVVWTKRATAGVIPVRPRAR